MQWRTGQCSVCHQTLFRSFVLRDQFVAIVLVLRKQGALTASTMRAASCWCELFGARWDSVSLTSFSVIASRMYAFSKCSVVWQSDNTVRRENVISRPRACATLIMAYRSAMSSNLRRSFAEVCSLISCTHDTQCWFNPTEDAAWGAERHYRPDNHRGVRRRRWALHG